MSLGIQAIKQIREAAFSVRGFAKHFVGIDLYPYQEEAAEAIVDSVLKRDGNSFVLIFTRQGGKDETLAIIFLYLMCRFYDKGIDIVCAQPTFKPQTISAMERLMKRGVNFGRRLKRSAGYIMRAGQARTVYFSAEPRAAQVGATADRLLVMNEAQDILPGVYDKRFAPMAASGNATKVFSGTCWTSTTLLGRELRMAREAEKRDGVKRVFLVDSDEVGKANPYYKKHVEDEIKKLGRNHPFIRTQYFCEEVDAQAGMFTPRRRALMQGDEAPPPTPTQIHAQQMEEKRRVYAFLLDVAGQDEARMNLDETGGLSNPGRDAASLSIVSIDLSSLATLQAPTYRIVQRQQWTGENHLVLFGKLKSLAESWQPQYIVIDATGVGEGLWAMLDKAFPGKVMAVKFSQQVKSEIGWRYLAIIESGRVRDCCPSDDLQGRSVRLQYEACQSEVLPGAGKILRWGVPQGKRGPEGELIHDDYILADALVAELDRLGWYVSTELTVSEGFDPFEHLL
jgi:hypothetical protein